MGTIKEELGTKEGPIGKFMGGSNIDEGENGHVLLAAFGGCN